MNRVLLWPALLLVTGGLLGVYLGGRPSASGLSIEEHQALLISRMSEVAELVTLKVPVSRVMTRELTGYVGGIQCVVVVNGEVALGVDLEQVRIKDVEPEDRTATLVLPEPKVRYARLDHERTTIYDVSRQGLWWLTLGDEAARKLVNKAMKQAQVTVRSAARDPSLVEQARRRAERVLRTAFEAIGWDLKTQWAG